MKHLFAVLTGLTLLFSNSAMAAIGCTGTVSTIIIGPDGDVYANFGHNRLKICIADSSLTVNRGVNQGGQVTISPGRCALLVSAFMTAKASGRPVTAHVDRTDCNFGDGAVPDPYPYHYYFEP